MSIFHDIRFFRQSDGHGHHSICNWFVRQCTLPNHLRCCDRFDMSHMGDNMRCTGRMHTLRSGRIPTLLPWYVPSQLYNGNSIVNSTTNQNWSEYNSCTCRVSMGCEKQRNTRRLGEQTALKWTAPFPMLPPLTLQLQTQSTSPFSLLVFPRSNLHTELERDVSKSAK